MHNTKQADWHTVTIDLASVAADEEGPHRLVSISDDGWTYAIEDSVMWTDKRDVLHDSGWPECLPRHPGFMDRSHEMVRFSSPRLTADTGNVGWRPVVMVDCGQQD